MKYLLMILFSSNLAFASIGFENGHQLNVVPLEGVVHFTCYDDHSINRPRSLRCLGEDVSPYRTDYFMADVDFKVKKLHLSSEWQNGNIEEKRIRFNNKKKRSKNRVNLWIDTLFQEPLLGEGINLVSYHLEGEKQSLRGHIEFNVNVEPKQYCEPLNLGFRYRCIADDNRACSDYYQRKPSCE